ncbi:MAG: sulfatase [Kiritimatiellales bacterium]|nr:sulfatase [Kiritimatiellales bacterium]MCF7863315.1 sulfatase [Kiritimatiellales bacterium]
MKTGLLCSTMLCGGLLITSSLTATPAAQPNILVFYADDLGYGELGCYGNQHFRSPNIDAIAKNGIRFTQGYVSAPLCSPSRAGIMTGRYPTRFGHENNTMGPDHCLPLTETTIANRLKALGYATGICGKWHLGGTPETLPLKRGFDDYYGVAGNPGSYYKPNGFVDSRLSADVRDAPANPDFYTTDAFGDWATEWIGQHKDGPWFLYLPFNAVHGPHQVPEKYMQRFPNLDDREQRTLAAMISAMDDAVGRVMAKVKELGMENNTLVYFISDNGAPGGDTRNGNVPLRGFKHTTWEGGMRVPFMMQWPGKLPAGVVSDTPVIQLDVLPTSVVAAGGKTEPAWALDGTDLMPFLTGTVKGLPHKTFYWRIDGMWAVRDGDWKLVHGKAGSEPPELFNLANDIGETNDLAAVQPEKMQELKTLWDAWNVHQAPPVAPKDKVTKRAKAKKKTAGEPPKKRKQTAKEQ